MKKLKKADYIPGFILAGFIVIFMVAGFFPGSAAAKDYNYGPWASGSKNSAEGWQADLQPWNKNTRESFDSGCIVDGKPLSELERSMLSQILVAAGQVYNNRFSSNESGTIPIKDKDALKEREKGDGYKDQEMFEVNGGYPSGSEGYREFVKDEKELLNKSGWLSYGQRMVSGGGDEAFGANDYQVPSGTYVITTLDPKTKELLKEKPGTSFWKVVVVGAPALIFGTIGSIGGPITGGLAAGGGAALGYGAYELFWGDDDSPVDISKQQKRLAQFIPSGGNPLETAFNLPMGCTLPIPSAPDVTTNDFFGNPVSFIFGAIAGIVDRIVSVPYLMVNERAWQWTFITPHTERGDLIWQLPTSCASQNPQKNKAAIKDACKNGKFLGFSQERTTIKNQKAPFLSMSHFTQWLISGFYFIIFFTAIVIFIVRGTKARTLNVMKILPRLFLSILLTLFAVFIIGAIITFANFLVISILGSGSWEVGAMNVMLTQPDLVMGGLDVSGGTLVRVIVKTIVTYFYILFVLAALIRQLALVVVVVLAPLAIFCIINPSWMPQFNKWLRTLIAIAFIPVVLALLLKLGLVINPAIMNPSSTYGSAGLGLFSILMLLMTMWAMSRVIKASRNFILGQSSMVSGAMSGVGDKLSRWGANRDGAAGRLARRAGGNLEASGANASALGQMVPPDKVLGGGYSGLKAAGGGGALGAARAGLGGSIAPTHSKLPDRLQAFQAQRLANFDAANTAKETKNAVGFSRVQQDIDERVGRAKDDFHTIAPTRHGQALIAQRDAIVSAAMSSELGGLPIKRHGRLYVETSREAVSDIVESQLRKSQYYQGP